MSGLKRIGDLPAELACQDPGHYPPQHVVLDDGIYEYECPSCGFKRTFAVRQNWLGRIPSIRTEAS